MSHKIYVLKLQEDKFYVGKTLNFERRYEEHCLEIGSEWTKTYGVIGIIETIDGDGHDEFKYVIKYMSEYGIDNVRGGPFPGKYISASERKVITRIIRSNTDKCLKCGGNHFVADCNVSTETPSSIHTNQSLEKMTNEQLKDKCRQLGIKGFSGKTKAVLVSLIENYYSTGGNDVDSRPESMSELKSSISSSCNKILTSKHADETNSILEDIPNKPSPGLRKFSLDEGYYTPFVLSLFDKFLEEEYPGCFKPCVFDGKGLRADRLKPSSCIICKSERERSFQHEKNAYSAYVGKDGWLHVMCFASERKVSLPVFNIEYERVKNMWDNYPPTRLILTLKKRSNLI